MQPAGAHGARPGIRGWVGAFHPARVPLMSRPAYRRELIAATVLPFLLVVFEGSVMSVLARLTFEGAVDDRLLNQVTGVIAVVPALANLSSFIWVRLSHGAGKVRFITGLQLAMVVLALGVAFVPINAFGLILIAVLCLLGRTCWAGVTTIRSTIWKLNYPDGARATITGRFAMIQVLLLAALSSGLGVLMDLDDRAFRVLIPIGCVLGLVARWAWSRVRVRQHRMLVAGEENNGARGGPSFNPLKMISVLTDDRRYAAYMGCQFLLGIGNIMSMTLLAIVIRETFNVEYSQSLLITTVLQFGIMPLAIPFWARFLDGTHIVRFRAVHSWVFVVALALLLVGVATETFALLYAFALLKGIAFGGGVLGWTLGHLDFATPEKSSQYMGVHVTLTGVRGLVAATLGVAIYELLGGADGGAVPFISLCLGLTLSGAIGFVIMARHFRREGLFHRTGSPEPQQPSQVER